MVRYLVGRVLQTLLSMLVVISVVFVLTRLSGNPVHLLLGRVSDLYFHWTLMLDSRVLRDQELNKRMKQRFASLSDVMNKREETQVQGEFLLGYAPMRTKPTPQERPEAFHRIHMDCTKAIAIFISSELAPSMVHTLMSVSPGLQTVLNAVLVRVNQCPWNNGVFDEGLDRLVLHIGHQLNHHLTATLNHPKDRRPFLL